MHSKRRVSQKKRVTKRREKKLSKKGGRRNKTRKYLHKRKGGLSNSDKITEFLTRAGNILTRYLSTSSEESSETYRIMEQQSETLSEDIRQAYPSDNLSEPIIDTRQPSPDDDINKRTYIQNILESLSKVLQNLDIIIKKKEDAVASGTSHTGYRAMFGFDSGIVSVRKQYDEVYKKYGEAEKK